jgi:hypothetical protein
MGQLRPVICRQLSPQLISWDMDSGHYSGITMLKGEEALNKGYKCRARTIGF